MSKPTAEAEQSVMFFFNHVSASFTFFCVNNLDSFGRLC